MEVKAGLDISKMSYKAAKMVIAERIKNARLNTGLSQCYVAQCLSISQSSYSRMEAGATAPDCAQIRILSGLYGISILWFLGMPNFVVYAA